MRFRSLCCFIVLTVAACGPVGQPRRGDAIDWAVVRNPVHGLADAAIKDAFAVAHEGRWHLGYSHIRDDPFRFRLGLSHTDDWSGFEEATALDQLDVGGLASPDVVRMPDGRFVMTYNSHTHDVGTTSNKLYYRTSDDLVTWSDPVRLHVDGADAAEDRLIDAALAFDDSGAYLFFKREQTATLAHSPTGSIDGPWTLLGTTTPSNLENVQLLRIHGTWHLLGTTIPLVHRPVLHRLEGPPSDPQSWRAWTVVREFNIRRQSWNTGPNDLSYERANAAYLVDNRPADGFFYLLYAGSTDREKFEARGHSSLGLARSSDLTAWESAPERETP